MFYLLGRGIWFCVCKILFFIFLFFKFFLGFFFPSS
jgi:hypothetical protein